MYMNADKFNRAIQYNINPDEVWIDKIHGCNDKDDPQSQFDLPFPDHGDNFVTVSWDEMMQELKLKKGDS